MRLGFFSKPEVLLPVPFFKQDRSFTCGPTAVQMACAFWGARLSESKLVKLAHSSPFGTSHGGLLQSVLDAGLYCYLNADTSIEEIKYLLRSGWPVIVNYTEPSTNDGHYAVAVGFSERSIILNDPWNGPNFKLPWPEFERRWYDHGLHRSSHWLLAVADQPFTLGRTYAP